MNELFLLVFLSTSGFQYREFSDAQEACESASKVDAWSDFAYRVNGFTVGHEIKIPAMLFRIQAQECVTPGVDRGCESPVMGGCLSTTLEMPVRGSGSAFCLPGKCVGSVKLTRVTCEIEKPAPVWRIKEVGP